MTTHVDMRARLKGWLRLGVWVMGVLGILGIYFGYSTVMAYAGEPVVWTAAWILVATFLATGALLWWNDRASRPASHRSTHRR